MLFRSSHSTPFEVLSGGGMIGVAFFGAFVLLPLVGLARLFRRAPDGESRQFAAALTGVWIVFAVGCLFSVAFTDQRDFVQIYAAICGYLQRQRLAWA